MAFHLVPRNEYILSQCKHLVDGEYWPIVRPFAEPQLDVA